MAEQCFREKDLNPAVCGEHKVQLVLSESPLDPLAPHLGRVSVLVCPISGLVVDDVPGQKPGSDA